MKFLVFVTDAFGGHGGIAKFNRDLLHALCADPECEKVVALPRVVRHAVGPLPEKLDFRTAAARGIAAYAAEVARVALTTRIDGVICGHLHLLPLAAAAATARGVPLLLVTHGVECWKPPARRRALGPSLRRVDTLVSVSRTTQERFLSWARIRPRQAFVIPNCVDQSLFGGARPKNRELLQRYGLEGRTVLLTLGRLVADERYKGIDEILELLPALSRELPSVAYLIIGEGDDRARLEAKAAGLGVGERVVFAGHVSEQEKPEHYRIADLFVMVGYGEGFGIVYLEALACGIPVVASAADASREAVLEGELGEVANPRDPEDVRRAILRGLGSQRGVPQGLQYFSVAQFRERWQRAIAVGFAGRKRATPMTASEVIS